MKIDWTLVDIEEIQFFGVVMVLWLFKKGESRPFGDTHFLK